MTKKTERSFVKVEIMHLRLDGWICVQCEREFDRGDQIPHFRPVFSSALVFRGG
jgi:hypothetical protein